MNGRQISDIDPSPPIRHWPPNLGHRAIPHAQRKEMLLVPKKLFFPFQA